MDLINQRNIGGFWDFLRKAKSYVIWPLLVLGSVVIAYGTVMFGVGFGILILLAFIGVPVLIYSIINLRFGVITLMIISFFLLRINRIVGSDYSLGILLDVFLVVMVIGLIIKKVQRKDFSWAKSPVSVIVWIWIIYNILEFFNPLASKQAWVFVIRSVAILLIFYFIILEAINERKFLKLLLHVWIALSVIAGIYGLFQEFHGLLPSEKEWVMADEFRFKLIFNWGRYRIFSFLNDPTVYGILMSFSGLFCITLLTGPFNFMYKLIMAICGGIMLLAMVYAGTRTAFAMLPAGFAFYSLLTFQKKTIAFGLLVGLIGAGIIFSDIRSLGPLMSTNSLTRIRSTFRPSEDPSFQVRERSQEMIKPFIQSHPIGAGLGSVGIWGKRFNPNSELAEFAPDSGYVRIAVELGWIGLFLYCAFFATILIVGVHNYYLINDPELKAYMASIVAVVYAIAVGNYPQQAIIQVPNILIFYALMAMIVKMKDLDVSTLK